MCGIFALLNNSCTYSDEFIKTQFNKGKNRGPEFSKLQNTYLKCIFGFHRLAINGLDEISNQPIILNNIALICNGEIYNYRELYTLMGIQPQTNSDCEVIIYLYEKYGMEQTLQLIEGVFAFVLCDYRTANTQLYVARDPYGVRPLYMLSSSSSSDNLTSLTTKEEIFGFASELKVLSEFCSERPDLTVRQFIPGTYSEFTISDKAISTWKYMGESIAYHKPSFSSHTLTQILSPTQYEKYLYGIREHLQLSIAKRYITTDRKIACLLSGGLDSSLITALVCEQHKKQQCIMDQPNATNQNITNIETYSIGLAGSEDLRYAKIVADYLGTKHTEIIVTEDEMFEVIPEVIHAIESYDTTTIRASIGNYLLGKYISKHSDAKVIFNGDGSDELCGGYLYMNQCNDVFEFDKETKRLLRDIYLFDVLRSDKSISSHGLEPRTPFLDKSFVQYYLSIPHSIRCHTFSKNCEKFLLRSAFSSKYYLNSEGKQILPDEILWRRKEAFSDGVSGTGPSLFQILQQKITEKLNQTDNGATQYAENIETEKYYYKKWFDYYYPNMSHILPYFWMPKYTRNATDPSARTLDIYHNT